MFNRKGQNIAEYSILIALVIAAAVAMQVYVKRGVQGRVADAVDFHPNVAIVDEAGNPITILNYKTPQYEPYYTKSAGEVESASGRTENILANGAKNVNIAGEVTTRIKDAYDQTTWNSQTAR